MAEIMNLTLEQQEAISEIEKNLQIIACAGSGKTEVITRRIANILKNKPDIKPENIVAFTFTEKAAESMKKRIIKATKPGSHGFVSKMYIGTIHGFCYHILNKYTDKFQDYKILDTVKNHLFVSRYYAECGVNDLNLYPHPRSINLFLQCIDKMIDDYDNRDMWTQKQRDVLDKYINCLYEHGYIDFSLMIFEVLRQIKENQEVRAYLSNIKYLVVDEYQDINDLQERLILRIAEAGANICVVGDDDQTIYQFRGSNANNMISFSDRYDNVHQVRLEKNFRSAAEIVNVADCIIGNNERRIPKNMISALNDIKANVEAIRYIDKAEQFDGIAKRIDELHRSGVPYNEIAILVRKGKVIVPVSEALDRAGIPFETDSAEHFFSGDYFSRFVTTLQILVDVDKAKLYECWRDLVGGPLFNRGFKYIRKCARDGAFSLSEIISGFCEQIAFLDDCEEDVDVRRMDLNGIIKILNDYDEIYGDWQLSARIKGVLKFLATQAAEEYKYHSFKPKDPNADVVHIMTVHKAKGLEFHSVFLPELTKHEFPVLNMGGQKYWHVLGGTFEENKYKYESDIEDERKLFYVAVTRAKQNIYMTYELSSQRVSPFVMEASTSSHLKINRSDLYFDSKVDTDNYILKSKPMHETKSYELKLEYEDSYDKKQEYWEIVRYAKCQLYDFYISGARFYPSMYSMITEIKNWSPEKIIEEASNNGLI